MKKSWTGSTSLSSDEEFLKGVRKKISLLEDQFREREMIQRAQKKLFISRCKLMFTFILILASFVYICFQLSNQTMLFYGGSILMLVVAIIDEYFITTKESYSWKSK